ncbi:AfsR/SARP family transcriptional regulator [Actinoallomurus soli]|uniref:AfsR/SARP family transcriptional regulator n=1 Tax=Actinoallomurus soli TaxID=2952535 RepID=UPI002093C5DA|nr:BTAD domain-containing putative transcriptional regulator [Actinoallomurus soli]MCO5967174.1 SARP family transcriptional regulator [Actinoallomurus soli]
MKATAPPRPGAGEFSVHLLGCFELRREQVPLPVSPAAQRLLAYLATRTGMVTRPATAATLWPDFPDRRAAANLRSTLWRLRQERAGGPVHCTPYGIELHPDVLVDVEVIRVRSAELPTAGDDDCGLDPSVLSQDVLPDWPDEWLLPTREWFRQVRLHALDALCARHRRCGRFDAALDAGMRAVACEPLRESAHRAVALVHLDEGNPAEALRQYEVYRRLLHAELGLPPSQRFRCLIAPLLGRPLDVVT